MLGTCLAWTRATHQQQSPQQLVLPVQGGVDCSEVAAFQVIYPTFGQRSWPSQRSPPLIHRGILHRLNEFSAIHRKAALRPGAGVEQPFDVIDSEVQEPLPLTLAMSGPLRQPGPHWWSHHSVKVRPIAFWWSRPEEGLHRRVRCRAGPGRRRHVSSGMRHVRSPLLPLRWWELFLKKGTSELCGTKKPATEREIKSTFQHYSFYTDLCITRYAHEQTKNYF